MKITIVGAGAIGGTMGAYLARAGCEITFVDVAEDHVEAINTRGLTIESQDETFTVGARALLPDQMQGPLGMVFLATKTMHTDIAARQIAPHLAPDGAIVSMQNGFNEERIAAVVGAQRTIGACVNFGADYLEPGRIMFGGAGALYVGELDGTTSARVVEVVEALRSSFLPHAQATTNIWGYLWGKHAYAAMLKATALTDETIADVLAHPEARPALANLAAEVLALAEAEGVRPEAFDGFEPDAFVFPPPPRPGQDGSQPRRPGRGQPQVGQGQERRLAGPGGAHAQDRGRNRGSGAARTGPEAPHPYPFGGCGRRHDRRGRSGEAVQKLGQHPGAGPPEYAHLRRPG
ncbi:MAG: 2-dehydropantoate 2-reductase [Armatimonadota bacterium]|nr:2-dehydropantoate 2-reductase [Armatimonadota bacterium]